MKPVPLFGTLFGLAVVTASVSAETHRFVPTSFHATRSGTHPPALRIRSGDRVATSTVDDAGVDASGNTVARSSIPQTGPFFIEGAEPGDLLVVTLDRIEPNRATGASVSQLAPGAVPAGTIGGRPEPTRFPWTIDRDRRVVRLDLQATMPRVPWASRFRAAAIEMPLRPTLGSIGLAPATADGPATAVAGPAGGNMVSASLEPGARVMLAVQQPGALLYIGHGHARQGDGDISGTGVETSLDVEFSVEVVKRRSWPHSTVARPSTVVGEFEMAWPRVETADHLMAIGSGTTLQQAMQHATLELHHWLDDDFGLSEQAVSLFLGQALELEISQISNGTEPAFTVTAKVRKAYLPAGAAGT